MTENLFTDETATDVVTEETTETTEEETTETGSALAVVLVDETPETEPVVTITAEQAAEAIVIAAETWAEAQDAMTQADVSFRQSALAVVGASKGGVSDLAIANAVKAIKKARQDVKGLTTDLYSSPTSVGYHRRTGLVLSLEGSLPEGVSGRDVQTTIKGLPAKIADAIIGAAEDQCSAYEALSLALAKARAAKAEADAKAEEDAADEGEGKAEKIKDAAHYLKAASNSITKASECSDDEWTDEALAAARVIMETLSARLAVLPGATRGHLSVAN